MTLGDLPDIHIQETVGEVLDDVEREKVGEERFWVELNGLHYAVTAKRSNKGLSLDCPGLEVCYDNSILSFDRKFRFILGKYLEAPFVPQSCGDVDTVTNRVLAGDSKGSLAIYDPDTQSRIGFEGHILHTSVAKFFPSTEVILSAGMDFAMKIWDARTGRLAQTMQHQRGMVDSVEMIDRGRNILSLCTSDSTVALWECGSSQVIHEWSAPGAQAIALYGKSSGEGDGPNEFGVAGHSLLLGTKGSLDIYDLRTRHRNLTMKTSAIHSLSCSGNDVVAAEPGSVNVYDARMMNHALQEIQASAEQVANTSSSILMRTASGIYRHRQNSFDKLGGGSQYITLQKDILYSFGEAVRAYVHI